MTALVRGHFHSSLPLKSKDREATVTQIAALACIGLRDDSLHVKFSALEPAKTDGASPEAVLLADVDERLRKLRRRRDIRLSAANAQALGLVETYADGVRFPHSILQAYLGSLPPA